MEARHNTAPWEHKRTEALGVDVKMSTLVMDSRQTELLQVLLVEDNALDAKFITGLLCFPLPALQCQHVTRLGEALKHLKTTILT